MRHPPPRTASQDPAKKRTRHASWSHLQRTILLNKETALLESPPSTYPSAPTARLRKLASSPTSTLTEISMWPVPPTLSTLISSTATAQASSAPPFLSATL